MHASTVTFAAIPARSPHKPIQERDIREVMRTTGMDYIQARNHLIARQYARTQSPTQGPARE